MLNSMIFEKYGYDLQSDVEERYLEIVDYYLSFWEDDSVFDGCYRWLFPPGFIDRDLERAKRIMRDLEDIVSSSIIRRKLDPIYCYVISNMIIDWYTQGEDMEMDMLPKNVKKYLRNLGSDSEEKKAYIRSWFTDAGAW